MQTITFINNHLILTPLIKSHIPYFELISEPSCEIIYPPARTNIIRFKNVLYCAIYKKIHKLKKIENINDCIRICNYYGICSANYVKLLFNSMKDNFRTYFQEEYIHTRSLSLKTFSNEDTNILIQIYNNVFNTNIFEDYETIWLKLNNKRGWTRDNIKLFCDYLDGSTLSTNLSRVSKKIQLKIVFDSLKYYEYRHPLFMKKIIEIFPREKVLYIVSNIKMCVITEERYFNSPDKGVIRNNFDKMCSRYRLKPPKIDGHDNKHDPVYLEILNYLSNNTSKELINDVYDIFNLGIEQLYENYFEYADINELYKICINTNNEKLLLFVDNKVSRKNCFKSSKHRIPDSINMSMLQLLYKIDDFKGYSSENITNFYPYIKRICMICNIDNKNTWCCENCELIHSRKYQNYLSSNLNYGQQHYHETINTIMNINPSYLLWIATSSGYKNKDKIMYCVCKYIYELVNKT